MTSPQWPWVPPDKFLFNVLETLIPWNNMTNKLIYNEILALVDVEFQLIGSVGLDLYTQSASVQIAMEDRLDNSSNAECTRQQWMDFIALMCAELRLIEDNAYDYEVSDALELNLKRTMGNIPNVTHKNAIYNVIDIYMTEFRALEDAAL